MDNDEQLEKASDITGKTVVNGKGEELGVIEELVADSIDGRIGYVALSYGRIPGSENRLIAMPWESLTMVADNRYVADIDRNMLRNAPELDGVHWPAPDDRQWMQQVYSYYHRNPYWI